VELNVKFSIDKLLYFLFLPQLAFTEQFQQLLMLLLIELWEPAAPEARHE